VADLVVVSGCYDRFSWMLLPVTVLLAEEGISEKHIAHLTQPPCSYQGIHNQDALDSMTPEQNMQLLCVGQNINTSVS